MPPPNEIDIAEILLGVHNSPALKAQPAPKRPRFDSEFSLDTLSDLCARENAMIRTDTSPAGTFVEDVDEEDSDEEDVDEDMDMASRGATASSAWVHPKDATLSAEAAAFLQKRRSEWAERPTETNHQLEGIAAVLPADQISIYNQDDRIGIYSLTERQYILERYMAKRSRRHWNKKIRYNCRKNLADRRIRVKGRFVRAEVAASIACKEVSVAGSYVPAMRHEQKVERLLSMRDAHGVPRSHSPALSDRSVARSTSARRQRSASVGASEDIYAYSYPSFSYSSRRFQGQAGKDGAAPHQDAVTEEAALAGQKRPRSRSFHLS